MHLKLVNHDLHYKHMKHILAMIQTDFVHILGCLSSVLRPLGRMMLSMHACSVIALPSFEFLRSLPCLT